MGGDSSGWSVYLHDSRPAFAYNYPGPEYAYLRGTEPVNPGTDTIRYEFEKTGPEPVGAGGTARLYVDDNLVAEGQISRTATVGYTMDETFDIGWDKGAPVSEDYGPNSKFTGTIIQVDFDVHPDYHPDLPTNLEHGEGHFQHAMLRQ